MRITFEGLPAALPRLLPADLKAGKPNCGIVAVAIAARVPVSEAMDTARRILKRRANWQGRTTFIEREVLLNHYGVKRDSRVDIYKKQTLQTKARTFDPTKIYIVTTTGHVQIVFAGHVIDQGGVKPMSSYGGRMKRVLFVQCVE